MATDSFKFWDSYMHALDRVDDATAGRLVKALCHEVFDGERQDFDGEPLLGMVYDVMLGQAVQSMELSRSARERGRKAAGVPKKAKAKQSLGGSKHSLSEKKGEERKGTELSSPTPNPTAAPGGRLTPPPAPDGPPLP